MAENKSSEVENGSGVNETAESQNVETIDLKKIDELNKQVEKFKNDYLYLRAEFENYKRNVIKERSELLKYGSERIVTDLLNVLDNFDRALETKTTSENFENFVKGIQMTATEFRAALSKNNIIELKADGLAFDPMIHEALGSEPTDAVPEGHIVKVFKKAYKLHDKVIRAAQVIVARKK